MAEADPPLKMLDQLQHIAAPDGRRSRRILRLALFLGLPLVVLIGGLALWFAGADTISTDNAYVKQDVVSVSAEVGGLITSVEVHENQLVQPGQVLFRINPEPYRIALAKADAALAAAQVRVSQLRTDLQTSGVNIDGSQADVRLAEAELSRQQELAAHGFTTKARLQAAETALANARWHARTAEVQSEKARAALANGSQLPGQNPQIALATAERDKAALDLARTVVRAPVGGRVSQAARLQVGQMMVSALPALSIVSGDRSWVEANFKENQLERLQPGQPATVRFDAFSHMALKGHVQSIGVGTGSVFSVLPAQNATGNWVKVTQRIPVRIVLDQPPPRNLLAGHIAEVSVNLGHRR